MPEAQKEIEEVRRRMEPAHGFHELGLHNDAWTALDDLPPEDKAHPLVVMLRLDILLALHRLDDAVVLGTGACRQWPIIDGFFFKTATALIDLSDHQKAKDLLLAGPPSLQQKAVYWYDLARCYADLEKWIKAANASGSASIVTKALGCRHRMILTLRQCGSLFSSSKKTIKNARFIEKGIHQVMSP
jgi:predicted Zn-dependent protease